MSCSSNLTDVICMERTVYPHSLLNTHMSSTKFMSLLIYLRKDFAENIKALIFTFNCLYQSEAFHQCKYLKIIDIS